MAIADNRSTTGGGGLLYPLLVIAAIAVIVLSATGVAAIMGWIPAALSGGTSGNASPEAGSVSGSQVAAGKPADPSPAAPPAERMHSCRNCGAVESIRAVETPGDTTWLGAVGGALVGGLLGNQVGRGRGRTAATAVGAGAGAYAGNEIERGVNRSTSYEVRVRMEDGALRVFHPRERPALAVGQKVRIDSGGMLVAR